MIQSDIGTVTVSIKHAFDIEELMKVVTDLATHDFTISAHKEDGKWVVEGSKPRNAPSFTVTPSAYDSIKVGN